MRELRLHVWKEWREQRATAAVLAGLIAALVAATVLLLPSDPVRDPVVLTCVPFACAALALVAIGGELLAGEERRGTLRFLERAPAGLRTAFLAKLALFVGIVPAFAAFGLGVALLASRLRSGTLSGPVLDTFSMKQLPLAALLAVWTFAVSTWVGRGALALPLAAMLLALLGWPVALAVGENPWLVPLGDQRALFYALGFAGALAAAALSFTRGLRFGRGSRSAAWRGLLVGALLLAPSGAWTAHRWHLSRTVDPMADDFVLSQGWLGADGRHVFVNGSRGFNRHVGGIAVTRSHDPWRAFVVELDSGAWREMDGGRGVWLPTGAERGSTGYEPTAPLDTIRLWRERDDQAFDARTLEPIAVAPTAPLLSDLPRGTSVGGWAGLGLRIVDTGDSRVDTVGFHDLHRGRTIWTRDLLQEGDDAFSVIVRPGRWVVPDSRHERWAALDPETGEREELGALSGCALGSDLTLADGRLLVLRAGELACFDPDTGEFAPIAFADGRSRAVRRVSSARTTRRPVGLREPIVLTLDTDGWRGLARLDLDTLELVRSRGSDDRAPRLVATEDDDTLLVVEDDRCLVRLRFGSDEVQLIFPR